MSALIRPARRILHPNGQWIGGGFGSKGATLRVFRIRAKSSGVGSGGDFELRTTPATAANSGWDGSPLTVINADVNLAAGQVLRNVDIRGFVRSAGPGSRIVNGLVRGRGTASTFVQTGLAKVAPVGQQVVFERVTFCPDVPRYYLNGIDGENFLALRCQFRNVVDAVHKTGPNGWVWGSYGTDFAFFDGSTGSDHSRDSEFPGWGHIDGIQDMGGPGLQDVGNTWEMYVDEDISVGVDTPLPSGPYAGQTLRQLFTSPLTGRINYGNAVTISPKVGAASGFKLLGSRYEGGRVHLQIPAQAAGFDTGNNGEISGTKHGVDLAPYSAGKSYQFMRASTGMGTFTTTAPPVFDNVPSVAAWNAATTTARPVAGQPLPGTLNPLSLTVRKA